MRSSHGNIVVIAVALFVAVIAIAEVEASVVSAFKLPVLTVRQRSPGKWTGCCSFLPLEISMSDARSPLRISMSDDTPNGSGTVIRNSLWTAALVAALQKESALQGIRISLDLKGGMDGPSAGAVMCLGIMTALDGREFPDDFAMMGTILPDGTVGLVGGVPEKLKAAAKNPKIKRVAIPAFQRFAKDASENWVDLFELGRELGLELFPVESIGDAYCLMHREKISRPVVPAALSVVRESAALEANAAEVFRSRDRAVNKRIAGLSSNDLQKVSKEFGRASVDPREAERRFEEGAIFDALDLISLSDAHLTATLKSWEFYLDYLERFLSKTDENRKLRQKQLCDMEGMREWPIETQLAFVDGFRKEVSDFCEVALGWKGVDDGKPGDEKTEPEEPYRFNPAFHMCRPVCRGICADAELGQGDGKRFVCRLCDRSCPNLGVAWHGSVPESRDPVLRLRSRVPEGRTRQGRKKRNRHAGPCGLLEGHDVCQGAFDGI